MFCANQHIFLFFIILELIGRGVSKARIRPLGIEAFDLLGNVGVRSTDAVVGPENHALVLEAAPEPLDEHVVVKPKVCRLGTTPCPC
jgi:hypothetical protein